MPLRYSEVRAEHRAVRSGAGVFDVSHLSVFEIDGRDALSLLQRLVSSDVAAIAAGGAQYGLVCREDGGVIDDVVVYRVASSRYLMVGNASNHDRLLAWARANVGTLDTEIVDRIGDYAIVALQGPEAVGIAAGLASEALPGRYEVIEAPFAGRSALVCRTGYTGEDGVELLCAADDAGAIWDAIVAGGAEPAGLAARDTLRTEACLPLYGNDLMETRGPIEAGLGWCCDERTGFIGAEAVARIRADGASERLVPFVVRGSGIARQGAAVAGGGEVTSGTLSPCLGVGIGMAYLPADSAATGTELDIDVRGRTLRAVVVDRPIYRRSDPCQ